LPARSELIVVALLCSIGSMAHAAEREIDPGTQRMIERLEEAAREHALANEYNSAARLQALLRMQPGSSFGEQSVYRAQVGEQLLNTGRTRQVAQSDMAAAQTRLLELRVGASQ
jgi:hypothetical protein